MKSQKKQSFALMITSLILLFVLVGATVSTAYGAGTLPALKEARSAFIIPTFDIVSVVTDTSVTIRTYNFPANDTFVVRMGPIGTRGIGGTQVTTINSGAGGSFTETFSIPASLAGQGRIAIRLESPTSGYYSYNWFWNNTSDIPVTGPTATPGPSPTPRPPFVIPTFSITGVVRDTSVSIQTANFPANDTFNVTMGYMGTRGIGGINVGTFNSGTGGTQTATFNIPAALAGQDRIAIRLESPTSGYFSYNWFYNNTAGDIPVTGPTATPTPTATPGPSPTPTAPFVVPTFNITDVVRDTSVSIQTANFPANDTFNVTMGFMGTRGIGGINVGTFNSGTGGTQTATFSIPAALAGQGQIAIRLQSPTSGYYSFNWFYNNTTP